MGEVANMGIVKEFRIKAKSLQVEYTPQAEKALAQLKEAKVPDSIVTWLHLPPRNIRTFIKAINYIADDTNEYMTVKTFNNFVKGLMSFAPKEEVPVPAFLNTAFLSTSLH